LKKEGDYDMSKFQKSLAVGAICIMAFLTSAYNTMWQEKGEKPCLQCHGEKMDGLFKKKNVHFPFAQKECESCHDPKAFSLVAQGSDLCFGCHSDKADEFKKGHTHTPVKNGQCIKCHSPHASDNKYQLINDVPKLCFSCHKEDRFTKVKFTHFPVEEGNCLLCHGHHNGIDRSNLKGAVSDLCTTCHDKDSMIIPHPTDVIPTDKTLIPKDSQMKLDEKGMVTCVTCHNQHGSDLAFFLKESMEDGAMCYKCHKK
jgi:predicted CXXCH cytochrome family protein